MNTSRRKEPDPPVGAGELEVLDARLKLPDIKNASYGGYAQEPILRALHARFGKEFNVVDCWDRYSGGAAWCWAGSCWASRPDGP
jgi:hypothetical protein